MNKISHPYARLLTEMLGNPDDWEIHSFGIKEDSHAVTYGRCEINIYDDGLYVVSWTDCLMCDWQHVNCIERELVTEDAHEALECASIEGFSR